MEKKLKVSFNESNFDFMPIFINTLVIFVRCYWKLINKVSRFDIVKEATISLNLKFKARLINKAMAFIIERFKFVKETTSTKVANLI